MEHVIRMYGTCKNFFDKGKDEKSSDELVDYLKEQINYLHKNLLLAKDENKALQLYVSEQKKVDGLRSKLSVEQQFAQWLAKRYKDIEYLNNNDNIIMLFKTWSHSGQSISLSSERYAKDITKIDMYKITKDLFKLFEEDKKKHEKNQRILDGIP